MHYVKDGDGKTVAMPFDAPEVVDLAVPADPTPRQLCALALKAGAGIDVIERFSALAERWEATEAKKRWAEAVAAFKAECPPIIKRNVVADKAGKQLYKFAGYDDIKAVTIPLERKFGIVTGFTFDTTTPTSIKAILRVTVGSHTEEFVGAVPVPQSGAGGVNATQLMGQAQSYVKRYLYLAAFDIIVAGEDSDAIGLFERITPEQVGQIHTITDAFEKLKIPHNHKTFLRMYGVAEDGNTGDLPPDQFETVMRFLRVKLPKDHPLGDPSTKTAGGAKS